MSIKTKPSIGKTAGIKLSMDPETRERLSLYSAERRCSISQLVTEWIWSVELKSEKEAKEET